MDHICSKTQTPKSHNITSMDDATEHQQKWIQEKVFASKFDTFWINFTLPPVAFHGPYVDDAPIVEFCKNVNDTMHAMGVMHLVKKMTTDRRIPSSSILVQFVYVADNIPMYENIERRMRRIAGHVRMSSGLGWSGVTDRIVRNLQL